MMTSERSEGVGARLAKLSLVCVLSLISLHPLSSCYALLGVEHNYVAVRDLKPGMTLNECLDELRAGGRIELQEEFPIDLTEERDSAPLSSRVRAALMTAETETGRHAVRVQSLLRWWGTFGFGEVCLFLDSKSELVGYCLLHIN